ncbi:MULTISPECIES: stage II sporulation protein SB [Bacillus cereus group]|uniref:stage II sporulation protein SB n=1 Tax=Bacillus cereus group TaxID=86661 RepID=UPI001F55CA42|nr:MULTISPECIES: stage II sporulation protein SB [Bacillus cereus group]MDW3036899.1 stage II sporulation protein SB [Bacillus pacificus]
MAGVNVQKSSFFKEKKEEPNTDFSLVKGALTQNVDRLEKFVEAIPYKYIKEGNAKENA